MKPDTTQVSKIFFLRKDAINITGKKFGKLTVVKFTDLFNKNKQRLWECSCECGGTKLATSENLRIGKSKNCGCKPNEKHRLSDHPIYQVYRGIITRCYNPNSKSYKTIGRRGIRVCEEWRKDINAFCDWAVDKWKEGLCIDRVNPKENYSPENCRFVTRKQKLLHRSIIEKPINPVYGTWLITGKVPGSSRCTVECARCKRTGAFFRSNIETMQCRQCTCR